MASTTGKTYVVEHLDPEIGPWSTLEYGCIADEAQRARAHCYLSSVPESLQIPAELRGRSNLEVTSQSVETLFGHQLDRICLLDPAAKDELQPGDGTRFDIFLYGGILGG